MLKYCGAAICALAAVLVLKNGKSELASYVSLAASVILLGAAVAAFLPVYDYIREIVSGTSLENYLGIIGKALGVTLAVQATAEICRDSGEGALASKLELIGKAELLLLCLPLVGELISLASEIMSV